MAVRLLDDIPTMAAGSLAVLKVVDSRFSPNLGRSGSCPPWNGHIEKQYRSFVRVGHIEAYLAGVEASDDGEDDDDEDDSDECNEGYEESIAYNEALLYYDIQNMYRREVDVYDALKDLQGHHIPHLLVTLTVPVSPSTSFQKSKRDKTEDTVKYIDSPAIPLQYVNGYNLQKITDHCPRPTTAPGQPGDPSAKTQSAPSSSSQIAKFCT